MQSSKPTQYWQANLIAFIVLASSALFYLYAFFLRVMPTIITTELMQDFQINHTQLTMMIASFFVAYACMQIPAGLLCDYFGARRCLITAMATCAIATFLFQSTQNVYIAGLSRLVIGGMSGFAFIAPLALASKWYSAKYQALITGMIQVMGCFGAIFAGPPLQQIIHQFGWRASLYYAGIVGAGVTILFLLTLKDRPDTQGEPSAETTNPTNVQACFFRVILNSQNWGIGACALASWAPIAIFAESLGIPYLAALQDISTEAAAAQISWLWIAMAVASPLSGWVSNHFNNRKIPTFALLSLGFVSSMILVYYPPSSSPMAITGLLVMLGISSATQTVTFGLIHDNNANDITATACGFNNMVLVSSSAFLQPMTGFIISSLHTHGPVPIHVYQQAFSLVPITVLACIYILHKYVNETHCEKQTDRIHTVATPSAITKPAV